MYQQYLNKYNQGGQPAQTPAATPAPAQTPAQTPAPAAEPQLVAPVAETQPATAPEPVPALAPVQKEAKPPKEIVPIKPFEVKPYFSVSTFGSFTNGVYFFGKDNLSSSYKFELDNAILDLKGGNKMFNSRLLLDFARGFATSKVVEINYEHDPSAETGETNPLEMDVTPAQPNALDILRDVSLSMTHPTYRRGGFGMNVNLQAGKYNMPFGLETLYDHELTFTSNSHLNSAFLGDGFNDLGLTLGIDMLLSNEMNLGLKFFVFNGSNEAMLDGQDKFKDPAIGFDLRFKLDGKFYTTFAFSFIWGSVYHDYDENVKDGIFDTTNGTYLNEGAINPDESDKIEKTAATNDYALNKKNTVLSIAADLGYKANENIGFGLMAQFV